MPISRSIEFLAGSMTARSRAQEVLANNLANVNTDGFVRQRTSFANELAASGARIGVVAVADSSPGAIEATGRATDVALDGKQYLVVETPAGERYTRSGSLRLNAAGQVADRQGNAVLGDSGPLQPGTADFTISDAGEIMADGAAVGRLRIVEFPEGARLAPAGQGLLRASRPPVDVETARVIPAHRQSSNVDVVGEMITMMESFRAYEASAKALRAYDEVIGQLVRTTRDSVG